MFGRQESLGIKTRPGQAKVIGTIICVGGALILSFYHGNIINIGESSIHWTYAENMEKNSSTSSGHGNVILGPFLLILSSLSWSIWFIIQVSTQIHYTKAFDFLLFSKLYVKSLAYGMDQLLLFTLIKWEWFYAYWFVLHCMHGSSAISFRLSRFLVVLTVL